MKSTPEKWFLPKKTPTSVTLVCSRRNPTFEATSPAKRLLILCLAAGLSCGIANARTKADVKAPDSNKITVRNNAASLLEQLLDQDKNVSKILIIKRPAPEVGNLIKEIAKTAGQGADQLKAMAKTDTALKLDAQNLPPGESDARAAEAKTTEHELLSSSGPTFELRLLLTQAQALRYGSNLAKTASENSEAPEAARQFHSLDASLSALYQRVVAQMRVAVPSRPTK